jgi:hypothetical protein
MPKSRLSWWTENRSQTRICVTLEALTTIKDKLQLYQLHVNQIRIDRFMRHPHANVLKLNDITLERVLQPVVKRDKFWYL